MYKLQGPRIKLMVIVVNDMIPRMLIRLQRFRCKVHSDGYILGTKVLLTIKHSYCFHLLAFHKNENDLFVQILKTNINRQKKFTINEMV